jgi:simple sugar transport system permease protein
MNLIQNNAFLGIAAVGMTFVILSGGIDLSVGAVMSLSSVLTAVLITERGWPAAAAMAASVALGTAFGALMGGAIHVAGLRPFIVTLAGMFLARGLGYLVHLESIGIDDAGHARLAVWGVRLGAAFVPVTAIVFLSVVVVGAYVAAMTPFGRNVYALGGSEEAARLMGVAVGRTRIGVYALSGFCAALAGVVLTLHLSSGSHIEGVGLELDAIAAVVIGGTLLRGGVGSVFGTLVGVLMLGLILTVITTYEGGLSSGLTKVAVGLLLLAFVLLQRWLGGFADRPGGAAVA